MKKQINIDDYIFEEYISCEIIQERVKEIAKEISSDYKDKELVILITLKGAIIFAADLIRELTIPVRIETIVAKSYGTKLVTSGKVDIINNGLDLKNKDIVIVEDIVDTGITMRHLLENLEKEGPQSIAICSFLFKPENIIEEVEIKYCGFSIPPLFVVGYGLDYAEQGRNLKDIYIKIK